MKNVGKQFEEDFKASVPKDTYYLRLHDSAIGFHQVKGGYAVKSPYDSILCRNGQMVALELKSVKEDRISIGESKSHVIKKKQIENLIKAEKCGAIAGLLLNFRNRDETYFVKASDIHTYLLESEKCSIHYKKVQEIGLFIPQKIARTHWRYDLSVFFLKE